MAFGSNEIPVPSSSWHLSYSLEYHPDRLESECLKSKMQKEEFKKRDIFL